MADETHLRELSECGRTRRNSGFLRLGVEYRGIGRGAAEQRARVETDALNATVQQQAIEHSLAVTLGEEIVMPHFHRQWPLQCIDECGEFRQALWREAFRQLQPQRRDPSTQRAEQPSEGFGGRQLFAQVAAVADVAGEFGGEAKMLGHGFRPALHGAGSRARVEGRIAFYGVEYLGIEI
ncbi:hypothetical protein D3C87_1316400 [compost metagenome]